MLTKPSRSALRATPPPLSAPLREQLGSKDPESLVAPLWAYLDVAAAHIAANHVSLARKGHVGSPKDAAEHRLIDPSVRLSSTGLLSLVAGIDYDPELVRAIAVLSTLRGMPSPIEPAFARNGWSTFVRELNPSRREKGVDTTLTAQMIEDGLLGAMSDDLDPANVRITLIAGDGDYIDPVTRLREYGYYVTVMSFAHTLSRQLRQTASRSIELDPYFNQIVFYAH